MRKTILTMSAAFLMVVSAVQAKDLNYSDTSTTVFTEVKALALNSFCKAILQGDIETVKKLIDLGEDVNQKSLGMTPAMFAARYNKAEILELLIENGANLKMKSDKGYTAKKIAELSNAQDALAVLKTTT
ncbi:ankyrin repeat domain-containing protein [Eudoraea chungangensis]|uniref:ankyrin repeat domain-containing protein n=1 Tax=Eudoraea chungangensis TaxID=1481905 RepID=UPI0023EAA1AE|nr:ankyrin repeat domain-containing protein [Eudoraea chungangensis]